MKLRDLLSDDFLKEIEFKKVIRKGKVVKKQICPNGKKVVGKKCVPIKGSEKAKMKKGAKKRVGKMKNKMGKIMKKRAKSMKKRDAKNL
jgi:histidinol phosphatase-like enzyme